MKAIAFRNNGQRASFLRVLAGLAPRELRASARKLADEIREAHEFGRPAPDRFSRRRVR